MPLTVFAGTTTGEPNTPRRVVYLFCQLDDMFSEGSKVLSCSFAHMRLQITFHLRDNKYFRRDTEQIDRSLNLSQASTGFCFATNLKQRKQRDNK